MAKRRAKIQSWQWFEPAVLQSIADNSAAMAIPEARVVPIRPGTGPPTFAEKIADERQQATTLALKMLENGSNR